VVNRRKNRQQQR